MPRFRYEAIDAGGARRRGVMEAPSEAALLDRLRRAGSLPVSAELAAGAAPSEAVGPSVPTGGPRLTRQEVAEVMRELAVMLGAGQDLEGALRFLADSARSGRASRILGELRTLVRDGAALSEALARHPRSFPRALVGIVRAGEATGRQAETLERLAAMLERQRSLEATVRSALIYPTLLVLAAIGSIGLILGGVLPQFAPLFEQAGAALPAATRLLIAAGDAVSDYGMVAALAVLLGFLALRLALRVPAVQLWWHAALLRLPVVGGLAQEILAARVARLLGTLLTNGVQLMPALAILRDAVGNRAVVAAIDRAAETAREGRGLSAALAASGVLPARMVHLLRLGEEQAQLGAMALRAADIHETQAQRAVQALVALLVPAITVVMGGLVALIVAALLQAMLGLNDLAQ
jgi:general secretion pathway protein F